VVLCPFVAVDSAPEGRELPEGGLKEPIPASMVLLRVFVVDCSQAFSEEYTKAEEVRNVIRPTPATTR
jgi:hypothetical protein